MDKSKLEILFDSQFNLAESPFYDKNNKTLSWVDIVKGNLYLLDSSDNFKVINFNERIGSAVPLINSTGYLVFGTKGIYLYENDNIKLLYDLKNEYETFQRSNDAKADRLGRVWFSSIVDDEIHSPESKLFCYKNGIVECMDPDFKLGNGICFNKACNKMYFADSVNNAIYSYDYNLSEGSISKKKVLCNIYDLCPDGMLIDSDDNLWIAIWGGSRIEVRNSKNGMLKKTINIPTKNVTSLTYDPFNKEIIITTAKSDEVLGSIYKLKVHQDFPDIDYAKID